MCDILNIGDGMKKKIIIISIIVLIALAIVICLLIETNKHKSEKNEGFDSIIVSTLTIDVNPSIEINLNKDNIVVSVLALNEDSKKIIEEDYTKEKIEAVLTKIINNLKENDYLSEDNNAILINVETKNEILSSLIEETTNKALSEQGIKSEVIIQSVEITEELKEIASKNNITISKTYYIQEQIKDEEGLAIEDLKDKSISDIKAAITEFKEEQEKKKKENTTSETNATSNNSSDNKGSIEKCQNVRESVSLDQATNIAVSNAGGVYNPSGYCDIRSVDAYGALSPEGICSIMVSFDYKLKNYTYYINVETGEIISSPIVKSVPLTINESQCIIMRDIGVSAREQISIKTETDAGSEIVSTVEDNYGNLYEYHISKQNGSISAKTLVEPTP